jgi:hypothetical protein
MNTNLKIDMNNLEIDFAHEYALEILANEAYASEWLDITAAGGNRGWAEDPTKAAFALAKELREGNGEMPLYFGSHSFMGEGETVLFTRDGAVLSQ